MSTSTMAKTGRSWWLVGSMVGLGIGYFIAYTPYSALARGLSQGLLPGSGGAVGGLVLLPAAALGQLIAMPVFLLASGWWRDARTRQVGGTRIPFPGRETAASAFWMSLVVGTTTLNFTFTGFSILFMLVMMRIETIILAPTMDLIRRRKIHIYSWAALSLSLLSAIIAFTDVTSYRLSLAAFGSLGAYLAGYTGRFEIMSRHAKTGGPTDHRYFVEEHMTTPVVLVLLLAVPALIGQGSAMQALREGFTSFLVSPAAPYGFAIGICYEALFIFTTLIFLDRREYTFCVPVHVCSSLLAGVAAAFSLHALFGSASPSSASLLSALCVAGAAFALSYPAMRARLAGARLAGISPASFRWLIRPAPVPAGKLLLFVCDKNTGRSAMAEAIVHAELAAAPGATDSCQVISAGLAATPRSPMSSMATAALQDLGVPVGTHRARRLTRRMVDRASVVYCMTAAERDAVRALAPNAGATLTCLDPDGDIPHANGSPGAYRQCAAQIRQAVVRRLTELELHPTLPAAGLVVEPELGTP